MFAYLDVHALTTATIIDGSTKRSTVLDVTKLLRTGEVTGLQLTNEDEESTTANIALWYYVTFQLLARSLMTRF